MDYRRFGNSGACKRFYAIGLQLVFVLSLYGFTGNANGDSHRKVMVSLRHGYAICGGNGDSGANPGMTKVVRSPPNWGDRRSPRQRAET